MLISKRIENEIETDGDTCVEPMLFYGDNQSILWNTSVPDSMLKKKTSSVAYHFVWEGVSNDEWRTAYIRTSENPSDLLTKSLPSGMNRESKVKRILYDIYNENRKGMENV